MTVTIEKQWDGNVCETERGGRVYVSNGRWQWVVIVDGVPDSAHDLKRDARYRADALAAPVAATTGAHVRITARASRRIAGSAGATRALCGSPDLTAYDLDYADAKRASRADRAVWVGCAACRAKLPEAK